MFEGLGTALITPFDKNGEIDFKAFNFLLSRQIETVDFLVPCGTTGESPTLSHQEHIDVIRHTVEEAAGRVLVVAGTGSNSTKEAAALTEGAKGAGADGALVVSPYYNKPTVNGLRHYYKSVAEVGLPVILYDIPGRTARGVPTELIIELANDGVIAGVKWASGDQDQLMALISETPSDFSVLSGDDAFTYGLMAQGGDGAISVLSNILPADLYSMVTDCSYGNWDHAVRRHYKYLPLMRAMFLETNPIPIKTAFHLVYSDAHGGIAPEPYFRSPMIGMENENLKTLKEILRSFNLVI